MPYVRVASLHFMLAIVALLFIGLLFFLYIGDGPDNPWQYLTADRVAVLESLADRILAEEGLKTLNISYDKRFSSWSENLNRQPSTRFTDEVVPILVNNNLHALRANTERGSVIYGQFFFRRWYNYVYAPSGELNSSCHYSVIEHITNGWYFVR